MQGYSWDSEYKSGNFRHWEPNPLSPELAAIVAAGLIDKNSRILDIGSGGGLDAIFLARQGFSVAGVDLSRKALKIGKKRANKAAVQVDWIVGSAFNLPLKDDVVDFVVDRGLFHVIEDDDRPRYSSELFRVMKPSGSVVIRGASSEVRQDRFNPVTEQAIDEAFRKSKWRRGEVVPSSLSSCAGTIDARIVMLRKSRKNFRQRATR